MSVSYEQFLEQKKKTHNPTGFDANVKSEHLFEFQNFVVNRDLKNGKYAVFSGTGTGKTRMQLTWANEVYLETVKPVLILAPLAVSGQTIKEGESIGLEVTRASLDINKPHYATIQIANYEQLDNIDCSIYGGIALDEASIIKNHEGAYRNKILDLFYNTQYKAVFTATPSPNDPMELGNYAEFLNVMSRNEMLAMYFVHDGGETSKWMDIDYSKTLNGRDGRAEDDEKHIAPLQLQTIERSIHLWSNEGDRLLTPFGGIGSELFQAIKMKRKAIGFELKQSYWELGVQNISAAEKERNANFLFNV